MPGHKAPNMGPQFRIANPTPIYQARYKAGPGWTETSAYWYNIYRTNPDYETRVLMTVKPTGLMDAAHNTLEAELLHGMESALEELREHNNEYEHVSDREWVDRWISYLDDLNPEPKKDPNHELECGC